MIKIEILKVEPGIGIGKIKLGMKREEVYDTLKVKIDTKNEIEWIDNYHIEYKNDIVKFIEVPNELINQYFVLFDGIELFRTEAKILVKLLINYGKYDEDDFELGYSYRFSCIGLGLWRPVIFEYKDLENSEFKELDKEIQMDEIKHLYFESVCVFTEDYYND